MKIRLVIVKFFLIFIGIVIIGRLFFIQIIKGKKYQKIASTQYRREIVVPAKRGNIYDREMRLLAQDLEYYSFGYYPEKVKNPVKVANIFEKYTGEMSNTFLRKIRENKRFFWLQRKVDKNVGDEIWEHKLEGVSRSTDYGRFYPFSYTASQVIGFTDVDNKGLTGIEMQFNDILQGKDGNSIIKIDANGRIFSDPGYLYTPPKNGSDIILTIDLIYQTIAEEELKKTVIESDAKGGTVAIMNPKSGEILAMSSYPYFNPNDPLKYETSYYKNRFISDTFEPGSTFKIVTASALLEERIKEPNDIVFCENGKIKIYNHTINDVHPYGNLTFREVIEKSSNIGTLKCGLQLGKSKLYAYARDFGFGNETGLELIGETRGKLKKPSEWSRLSLPEISIGQEVAVSAVQLINAYASIANNGILMKPRIIKSIIGENGKIIKETSPEKIRRIVSEKTATILKSLFVGVVENGTGTNAKIEGIKIAGKTGTGQKSLSGQPGYSKTDYTSSFVGFWPADDPEFVCLVVIDSPRNGYFGGTVAAPAFRNIVERISNIPLRKSKIVWNNSDSKDNSGIKIPDVRYIPTNLAKNKLKNLEDSIEISGTGSFVFYQKPEPGKYLKNGEKIILTCSDNSIKYSENVEAPNLIGMSMREAINNIHLKNLKFKVTSGNGAVVEQSPKLGEIIKIGSTCYIRCADEINTQNTLAYK